MRKQSFALILAAGLLPGFTNAQDLSGYWTGALDISGQQLHLALHISRDGDAWRATMDSLDQGAEAIPVTSMELNGSALHFDVASILGSYAGKLDGAAITGTWSQSGRELPLNWKREPAPAASAKVELLDEKTAMEDGRKYTQWFYAGKTADLWSKFSPQMQKALGEEAKLKTFRDQVDEQAGAETKVTAETVTAAGRYQVYRRVAQFAKAPDGIEVEFSIDAKGTVGGFYVRPSTQK